MTAQIVFGAHPDGTDYRVTVRHGDPASCRLHEELGFHDGWGAVTDALASSTSCLEDLASGVPGSRRFISNPLASNAAPRPACAFSLRL